MESQKEAFFVGIFRENHLSGFCLAGVFHKAISGFLRENKKYLAMKLLFRPWLVGEPLIRDRLRLSWDTLFRRQTKKKAQTIIPNKSFGILAIAVEPNTQGSGLGREIMNEIEKAAREKKFRFMHLSVALENIKAIHFYKKLEWRELADVDGIWRGFMIKTL
jgi:ribosomal protein S18 acetylase RimI-like enzyme